MQPARVVPFLLTPFPYLFGFIFLLFTSLHIYSDFLVGVHVELLLTLAIIVTAAFSSLVLKKELSTQAQLLTFICLLLLGAPLISSLMNHEELGVLRNPEYRSWGKMLLIAPIVFTYFSGDKKGLLLEVTFLSAAAFALIFWYRFGVLGEVRTFDLRPTLQIKNGDPNFLCVLFATLLPLVLCRIMANLSPRKPAKLLYYGILFFLFLSCALASESRMGILSIGVGLFYLVGSFPKSYRRWVIAVIVVLGVASVFYGGILDRFTHLADESNRMRLKSMKAGALLFSTSPFFGHGWDSTVKHFFEYAGYPRLLSEMDPLEVHNTPLQILAELGFYGFLIYSGLFLFAAYQIRVGKTSISKYSTAALIILLLNLLTLPLQNKDFVLFLIVAIATINAGVSADGLVPNHGGRLFSQEIKQT